MFIKITYLDFILKSNLEISVKSSIQIHETAFVTSTYRSRKEALSKDIYAKLWNNAQTDAWIEEYLRAVSEYEVFTHCLRNRYFFETIKRLFEQGKIEYLINFGCGFSMYPFLLNEDLIHIEIDKEDVIEYKKERVKKWMNNGTLPSRKIHYVSQDFNKENEELISKIISITLQKPSFILIEGVLFFISQSDIDRLMQTFLKLQLNEGFVGSVSFIPDIENTQPFRQLIDFFEQKVVLNQKFNYQTLPTSYYENLDGYELIEHEDYVSTSKKYAPEQAIEDENSILNEHLYLLKRTI